jgi:hypothetical protein
MLERPRNSRLKRGPGSHLVLSSNSGFIQPLIGLVLIVGLVFILGMFTIKLRSPQITNEIEHSISQPVTPSPAVTASRLDSSIEWKTYQSEQYGYSIRYPSEWTVTHTNGVADTHEYIAFTDTSLSEASLPVLVVQIRSGSYAEELTKLRNGIGAVEEDDVKIANISGTKLASPNVSQGPGPKLFAYIFPFHSGSFVIIAAPQQEGIVYSDITDKMISMLSFTK